MVHDRPPAEDRRRSDVTYSGSQVERGNQVRSTGDTFLMLKLEQYEKSGTMTSAHIVTEAKSDHGQCPQAWASSFSRGDTASWTRHGGHDLLQ